MRDSKTASLLVVVAVGLGIASAADAQPGGGPPAVSVNVDAVLREQMQERRMVTGDLHAVHRSKVATRESGLVLTRPVREGQRVEAGQVLAELDARRLEIELRQVRADREVAQALVNERKAELEQASRDVELLQESFDRGAARPRELFDAESAVEIARTRVVQAERTQDLITARTDLLEQRVTDSRILAPFDGLVIATYADQGEWVGEGDAVVEIVSTAPIEGWLNIPQKLFTTAAHPDATIVLEVEATGQTKELTEKRIIPQVDPVARSFTLVVEMPNEEGLMAPGMSLLAWVPTEQISPQLTVSRDGILRNETGAFVYVARPGPEGGPARTEAVGIEVLFLSGGRAVVRSSGLKPGDQVIVEGNERAYPGMPVLPVPVATAKTVSSGDDA